MFIQHTRDSSIRAIVLFPYKSVAQPFHLVQMLKRYLEIPNISLQAFYARFRKQIHTAQSKIKQMAAKRTM